MIVNMGYPPRICKEKIASHWFYWNLKALSVLCKKQTQTLPLKYFYTMNCCQETFQNKFLIELLIEIALKTQRNKYCHISLVMKINWRNSEIQGFMPVHNIVFKYLSWIYE